MESAYYMANVTTAANILFGALAGALYELFEDQNIHDQPFLMDESEQKGNHSPPSDVALSYEKEEL